MSPRLWHEALCGTRLQPGCGRGFSLVLVTIVAASVSAQPQTRIATTIDALLTYPVFFHGRNVVVRGTLAERDGLWSLTSAAGDRRVHVLMKSTRPDTGAVEARGEFWDLGRLQQEDPRFAGYDMDRLIERVNQGRWPGQNQIFVLALELAGPGAAAPSTQATTIRAIALEPDKYDGQRVSVTGRFRGVNLFGDQPQAPGRSRYDFVLQSADAAIWVTGLQPKGKNWSLDRNARVDTGRWLEVTGTIGRSSGLVWIDAEKIGLGTAPEPAAVVEVAVPKVGAAPEVTFSLPTPEDIDVETSIVVRIQFSRDMEAASLKDGFACATSRRRPRGHPRRRLPSRPPTGREPRSWRSSSRRGSIGSASWKWSSSRASPRSTARSSRHRGN